MESMVVENEEGWRPFDKLKLHGPPHNPLPFEAPSFVRGRRDAVLVWTNNQHQKFSDVLFRDDGKRLDRAYWKIPSKAAIPTISGQVQICLVLKPSMSASDPDTDESENDNSGDDEDHDDVVLQPTDQYVAVKIHYMDRIHALRNKHSEDPMKEIAAMAYIGNKHPHVLGCHDVLADSQSVYVVMPYYRNGDLFQKLQESLKEVKPGIPEDCSRFYIRQILLGVQFLQRKGICHRDLSPENIMIDDTGCVVIDLGMCLRMPFIGDHGSVVDISQASNERRLLIKPQGTCGKLPYMSPEIFRNQDPFDGEAVDIWSLGAILFCMLTGNRSYHRPDPSDAQFYWMTSGIERLLKDWDVNISLEAVDLLKGMLKLDPRDRFTLHEVMTHAWFQQ
jgi:serine/threonine protein kinase